LFPTAPYEWQLTARGVTVRFWLQTYSACEDLREALLQSEIDIHLFDELARELLGYKATI
jgi:hypothetical protein